MFVQFESSIARSGLLALWKIISESNLFKENLLKMPRLSGLTYYSRLKTKFREPGGEKATSRHIVGL